MKEDLFSKYKGSREGFDEFNKLVINMPRHEFTSMNIEFVKLLASILINIKCDYTKKLTIIELYYLIHTFLLNNLEISNKFVLQLFDLNLKSEQDIKNYYNDNEGKGRNFRHLVEIMRMWGLIDEDTELSNLINYDACKEFIKLKSNEMEGLRSRMMGMDIVDNSFFISLSNISSKIRNKTIFSYKPAAAILKYIKSMNRPVSKFEISNLLAIITPECTSEFEVFDNALEIGKMLPNNIKEHKSWFFKYMNWIDENGKEFIYGSSQAPTFKFNTFILFLKDLDLVLEQDDEAIVLTDYSKRILEESIPPEIVELERYVDIAENSYTDKELADLIIYNTKPSLLYFAAQNNEFIDAMNRRTLQHPKYDFKGRKVRNKLIAELSKVRANYTCQVSGLPTFKDSKGNNYVESHHIIEFNREDGPDIIDNLIVISPLYHSLIHHAGKEDLYDFYDTLRKKSIVTLDTFKRMIDNYNCLKEKHIRALLDKKLITRIEYNELLQYIEKNVVTI